jgi:hypothetical protein
MISEYHVYERRALLSILLIDTDIALVVQLYNLAHLPYTVR